MPFSAIRLPRPKTVAVCAACLGVAAATAAGAAYWLFSPAHIEKALNAEMRAIGRQISHNGQIGRRFFPYPTVTFREVRLSRNGSSDAAYIDEMKIGFSWSSLFGKPSIRKWVFVRPEITLQRDEKGRWNIEDLLQRSGSRPDIDRLIIEEGKVLFDNGGALQTLHIKNLLIHNTSGGTPQFEAEGSLDGRPLAVSAWRSSGTIERGAGGWRMNDWQLQAESTVGRYPVRLKANSRVSRQSDNGRLNFNDLKLTADSTQYQSHLEANIPSAAWQYGRLLMPSLTALFTAQEDNAQWSGSLALNQLSWHQGLLYSEKAVLSGVHKTERQHTSFTLTSPLLRESDNSWLLEPLSLSTRQDSNTIATTRLLGEFSGRFRFSRNGWQSDLSGLFDRQKAEVHLNYQPQGYAQNPLLRAEVRLDKLSMTPYVENIRNSDGLFYPEWLGKRLLPPLSGRFDIGQLQMGSLNIEEFQTDIRADDKQVGLSEFGGKLYGGRIHGSLTVQNSQPLAMSWRQEAEDVDIRPFMRDLFGTSRLSGRGDVALDFAATGNSRSELIARLDGPLHLNVRQGYWHGLDLSDFIRQPTEQSQEAVTPFDRFEIDFNITDGVAHHSNSSLVSPLLNLSASGTVQLSDMTLNESVLVIPAGRGKVIPLHIRGPIDNPSVSMDYPALTQGLQSPQEKQQAITDALKEPLQWLQPRKP